MTEMNLEIEFNDLGQVASVNVEDLDAVAHGETRLSDLRGEEADFTEDELAHVGVKGMKWGHHKAQTSTSSGSVPSRGEIRAKNRLNKAKARVVSTKNKVEQEKAHDAAILAARSKVPQTQAKLQVAKAQYKVDKVTKGKVAAKATLNKVKDTHYSTLKTANLETGKENADRIKRENAEAINKLFEDANRRAQMRRQNESDRATAGRDTTSPGWATRL